MTAPLDISANLPVDTVTDFTAASVSGFANQLLGAYNSHVTNAAVSGYGPDKHITSHITAPVPTTGTALTNATVALDVRLNEIMTLVKTMNGTGTGYSDITVPITLNTINTNLTTNTSSSAVAGTWARRDGNGGASFSNLTFAPSTLYAALFINAATGNVLNPFEYALNSVSKMHLDYLGNYTGQAITGTTITGTSFVGPLTWTTASQASPFLNLTAGYTGVGTVSYGPVSVNGNYQVTSGPTALQTGLSGYNFTFNVGVGGGSPVAAIGGVDGFTSSIAVYNLSNSGADSEFAPWVSFLRSDANTIPTANTGRFWSQDNNMHGAITQRMNAFGGIHMFANNYYDGSPKGYVYTPAANTYYDPAIAVATSGVDSPSGDFWAMTMPGNGGGGSVAHSAATTYRKDVGFGVVGYSGIPGVAYASAGRGYLIGVQVGGRGGNWAIPYSRVGYGVHITDWDTEGLHIGAPHPSAAAGAYGLSVASGNFTVNGTTGALATGSIVGLGRATSAGIAVIIGGTLGNPLAGNAQALAVSPTLAPLVSTSAYGVNVAMTVDTTAGALTEAASFRSTALAKSGGGSIGTAYTAIFGVPATATATTVAVAKFDGTANSANGQVMTWDKTAHLAITQAAVATGTLGTNVTSVTCAGSDQLGKVTIVTSGAIGSGATVSVVTFATAMQNAPSDVTLIPASTATWALAGTAQFTTSTITTTGFTIIGGTTAPAAGTYVYRIVAV